MCHPGGFPGVQQAAYVDVSARRHPNGRVEVFLVNRNLVDSIATQVTGSGGTAANIEITRLTYDKVTVGNTFENPTRVAPRSETTMARHGKIEISLPPHSITRLGW